MKLDITREEYLHLLLMLENQEKQIKKETILPIHLVQVKKVNESLLNKLRGK